MNEPIGHSANRQMLEDTLPPVSLLLGPPSVGKRTMAEYLRAYHGFHVSDTLNTCDGTLTKAVVRQIIEFVSTAGFGRGKFVIVRLDGASHASLHALLKILEEPPPRTYFMLLSAERPLATIASRCTTFHFGLLTHAELEMILRHGGVGTVAAIRGATLGHGRVRPALMAAVAENSYAGSLDILEALAGADREAFAKATREVNESTRLMLLCWCNEATTGRWQVFEQRHQFGIPPERVRKIFLALCAVMTVNARLAIRAALEPFLTV